MRELAVTAKDVDGRQDYSLEVGIEQIGLFLVLIKLFFPNVRSDVH